MSSKQETVTVAARISTKLKEALDLLAGKLGLSESKLGRVALRLYLRYPPTTTADYELGQLAEKFPNNQTKLVSIALSREEASKLRELSTRLNKPMSHVLTLALANVFAESHSTILEESYAMGTPKKPYPGKAYGKAVAAGIINPTKLADSTKTSNPDSTKMSGRESKEGVAAPNPEGPEISLEQLAVVGTLIGIPVATAGLWLAANWKGLQKSLAELLHTTT